MWRSSIALNAAVIAYRDEMEGPVYASVSKRNPSGILKYPMRNRALCLQSRHMAVKLKSNRRGLSDRDLINASSHQASRVMANVCRALSQFTSCLRSSTSMCTIAYGQISRWRNLE